MKSVLAVLTLCFFAAANGALTSDPPFFSQIYYGGLGQVRSLIVDPSGDILSVQKNSEVYVFYEEDNGDGTIDVVRNRIIAGSGLGLNHGLAFHDGFIYASSQSRVYRWAYTPGNRTEVRSEEQLVIQAMPSGGHNTRTIVFDTEGRLYVSVGSNANVDNDSSRSRIRRFNIENTAEFPIAFNLGEVFADGLRNEVGLAWDLNGVLHGVENGADQLNRPDIGGDIHNGNPAEDFNRFDKAVGQHYGYPYCFSTHNLAGYAPGTQFAWPSFMNDGVHTDAWCRNVANNQPPLIPMPAHNAPLGIDFFRGQNCGNGDGAFPCNFTGNAFIAFHGSWNSDIPVGHRVGMYPFEDSNPTGDEEVYVVYESNAETCNTRLCFRPVDAVFNEKGHLFVSDDTLNRIVKVTYGQPPKPIRMQK